MGHLGVICTETMDDWQFWRSCVHLVAADLHFFKLHWGVKQGWPVVDQMAGMAIQGLGGCAAFLCCVAPG